MRIRANECKDKKMTTKSGKPIEIKDPFARSLMGRYLDNRKEDIGKLTDALVGGDFEIIRVTGHNLYGSGSAYGFETISRIGRDLEVAADTANGASVEALIRELAEFLQKLKVW